MSRSISRCLSQMERDGLSVDDLFSQCVFRQDERDMVLKAVHIVQPDYQPALNQNLSQCPSSLVEDFYLQVSGMTCTTEAQTAFYYNSHVFYQK